MYFFYITSDFCDMYIIHSSHNYPHSDYDIWRKINKKTEPYKVWTELDKNLWRKQFSISSFSHQHNLKIWSSSPSLAAMA